MIKKEKAPYNSYDPYKDPELLARAGGDTDHLKLLAERKKAAFAFNRVEPTDNEGMRAADNVFSAINEAVKAYEREHEIQLPGPVVPGVPE
ncbi:MAG: hypothetical protein ABI354_01825 [Candidatus Saccharimonadales bacterium]